MKKIFSFGVEILLILFIFLFHIPSFAQLADNGLTKKEHAKWYKSHTWLNDLKLIPHRSINQEEFSRQYHANKIWWDETFEFLKTHDLATLAPGRYVIDSGNVTAYVSEGPVKEKDQINWETHADFNDLQYVIKGKARMGIIPVTDTHATVTVPYDGKKDTETYSVDGGKYFVAEPGTFFVFSPKDIHRPAFKIDGYDVIKKVLIKVRVP